MNCSASILTDSQPHNISFVHKTSLFILSTLRCFNRFVAFNFFIPALLGIVFLCCKVFEIVKVGSSTLLARVSFPACLLHCTSRSRGRHSLYLACLLWHVFRAYFNFDSKQAISKTLFGRRQNKKQAAGEKSYDDIKFFFQVKAN